MAYKILGKNGLPIKREDSFLRGSDISEVKIMDLDEKEMTFLAVGSTEDPDRDKDIIRVDGWDLKNFKKNPVIPWGHNYYEPPIGKATMVKVNKDTKQLVFKPKFDADDDNAVKIFNKYKSGFLTSFSVGFLPSEYKYRDEENRWDGGMEFLKQELLEISAVTVPANPKANVHMRSIGEDAPINMVQMGYGECFTKSESGMYYPVRDISQFTDPREIEVAKGITAVTGSSLIRDAYDNVIPVVAYKFDMGHWTEGEAAAWLKENGPAGKQKIYFNMIGGGTKSAEDAKEIFAIEIYFKEEDIFGYEKDNSNDEETTEKETVIEIEEKDNSEEKTGGDKETEKEVSTEDETPSEDTDEDGVPSEKEVSAEAKTIALLESVVDGFSKMNATMDKISKVFDDMANAVEKNNESVDTDSVVPEGTEPEDDNLIEFDDSITPNDENTNKSQFIEIDSDSLDALLVDTQKALSSDQIGEQLKKALHETFKSALGQID